MLLSGGSWRACNVDEVVIARVFSRLFQGEKPLEEEIQRLQSIDHCCVGTHAWTCVELDGRYRIVYYFETPVPSSMSFQGLHCTSLFRAFGSISLPATSTQVNLNSRAR
jgi:hypothetical protein